MCEPSHSIVQYPDDFEPPAGTSQLEPQDSLKAAVGRGLDWLKKIGKWFHFSKFGAGHHEVASLTGRSYLYVSDPFLWEGYWWNRTFRYDGYSVNVNFLRIKNSAEEAAKKYHDACVMANMSTFRRFLETSMKRSNRAYLYVDYFITEVLTPEGRDKFLGKLSRVFGGKRDRGALLIGGLYGQHTHPKQKERAISLLMGFTRKRGLFLPHFADDGALWTPGGSVEGLLSTAT